MLDLAALVVAKISSFKKNVLKNTKLSIGEGNGTPLQYCCLENPMDGGAWRATATQLSN